MTMTLDKARADVSPTWSTSEDLGLASTGLVNAVVKVLEAEVKPFDMRTVEYALLQQCATLGETTVTELARVLPVDPPRISRMVDTMYKQGLLRRRRLTSDRRVVRLTLTDAGEELAAQTLERVQARYRALLDGVGEDDLTAFYFVVEQVIGNAGTQ